MSAGQCDLSKTGSSAWHGIRVKSEDCAQSGSAPDSGATHHDTDAQLPAADGVARQKSKTSSSAWHGICVKSEDCAQSGSAADSGATHHDTDAQLVPDVQHDSFVVRASSLTHESMVTAPVVPSSRSGRAPAPQCPHRHRKDRCKVCNSSAVCEHGKWKNICRDCGGSALCEHGKQKRQCLDCGSSRANARTVTAAPSANTKGRSHSAQTAKAALPKECPGR